MVTPVNSAQENIEVLQKQLADAEAVLNAIRRGEVDALVVSGKAGQGSQVFTLHAANQPYRVFVEAMSEGALTLAPDGLILYANRQFAELIQTPLQRVIGAQMSQFVATNDRASFDEFLTRSLQTSQKEVFQLRSVHGEPVACQCSSRFLQTAELEGICLVVTDLREITQHDEALRRSEEQLRKALAEKEVLLREIHHRVKNNLQVVVSLIALQATQLEDQGLHHLFRETQGRVRSMSLVHEQLYRSESLAEVDFSGYLAQLTRYLLSLYELEMTRFDIEVRVENVLLGVDTAIPCGLIINELVSNCLKHAFPGGRKGRVEVYLAADGDGYLLKVRDDGVGMASEIDWQNTESLGMQIVQSLVRQINGEMYMERANGTVVTIRFKGIPARNFAAQ